MLLNQVGKWIHATSNQSAYWSLSIIKGANIDLHRQVKINNKTEQCFGVVMTPLSSSK